MVSKIIKKSITLAAFTIGEALIALAIFGMVFDMTIPALVVNYRQKLVSTQLQKFNSVINNAIRLAEVEKGSMNQWIFTNFTDTILPFLKTNNIQRCNDSETGSTYSVLWLTDGTVLLTGYNEKIYFMAANSKMKDALERYLKTVPNGSNIYMGFIKPNILGNTRSGRVFSFTPVTDISRKRNKDNTNQISFVSKGIQMGGSPNVTVGDTSYFINQENTINDSRTRLLSNCKNRSGATKIDACSALAQKDGFKFKEDFPWSE